MTGLRYLAAALVLVSHAAPVLAAGTVIDQFGSGGYVGVTFFFVLSGFILTCSRRDGDTKASFYRRRFARIYPLYFVTWLLAVAVSFVSGADKSVTGIVLSLVLLQAWVPDPLVYGAGNPPGWSLSAEAFFYAVFPFIRFRNRAGRATATLILCATAFTVLGTVYAFTPWYSHWLAYYSPIYNLGAFLVGILLARAIREGFGRSIPLSGALAFVGVSYIALIMFAPTGLRGFLDAAMLPSVIALIAAAANADIQGVRTFWSRPFVEKLGQWSFALYLVHYSLARLLEKLLHGPLHTNPVVGAVLVIFFLAAATAASWLAYKFVEHPMERLLRGPRGRRTKQSEDLVPDRAG
ncbi:acyltransferase family protein [Arthrobacter sp. FW306-2-2C-D06B]|uniref:acyltransferase family protein n=1 Tax=Arthrobacter sp. FW306-2-2C-D06B TaxID=2879618 RepID=UPI001F1E3C67|nr:acyltransferase [Arthrobacter sp. FW306-2-2C-D06B]